MDDNDRSLKYDERLNGDQATTEKRTGGVANYRETSEDQRRIALASVYIKVPHHALTVITENADPRLVTQGWEGDNPCLVTVDTGANVTVAKAIYRCRMARKATGPTI
jgi:hypothetical protein